MIFKRVIVSGVVAVWCCAPSCLADDGPAIAAASDLKFALPVVAKEFEAATGKSVKLTFGSSGVLATQIANGAPFELFLSADESLVKDLASRGLLRDEGQVYALGRLAVFAPFGSAVTCDADLAGLKSALNAGKVSKVAIANPEHAPYGRAAQAALQKADAWTGVSTHLVLGESATQALQFATEGGADAALVPAPLVEAPEFPGKGCHERVSEALVAPLVQRLGVVKSASAIAADFALFITSANGREILAKCGFSFASPP